MHTDHAHDCHGLVVLFDSGWRAPNRKRVQEMGLLSRQLSIYAKVIPGQSILLWRVRRSPRQLVLAELVADGRASETAAVFQLGTDTVRKCVSRVFVTARVRNRTEPVRLIRRPRT